MGGMGYWAYYWGIQGLLLGSIPPFPTKHQGVVHDCQPGISRQEFVAKLLQLGWDISS